MNKHIYILIVALFPALLIAQTAGKNAVATEILQVAEPSIANIDALPIGQKQKSIQYVDGLGRPVQEILVGASAEQADVISFHEYDSLGRESKTHLPYTKPQNNGAFVLDPKTGQENFYFGKPNVAHTGKPFGEIVFDGSPVNRVRQSGSPGEVFQIGAGHEKKARTVVNTGGLPVRQWTLDGENAVSASIYPVGELIGEFQSDEDGAETYTWTDKLGRVICKRVLAVENVAARAPNGGLNDWHETYYVHDEFGRVAMVIPPKATALMRSTVNWNVGQLGQDLVFRYRYDARGRVTEKKVPGMDRQWVIYDNLDRPILTQDGNLRGQNRWKFIQFDVLGRPAVEGIFEDSIHVGRVSMQNWVDQLQDGVLPNHISRAPAPSNNGHGYSADAFPNTSHATGFYEIRMVTWYDDHDFDNDGTPDVAWTADAEYTDKTFSRLRGQVTGSKVRILNGPDVSAPVDWIETALFYDKDGNVIHSRSNNHLGTIDLAWSDYDFSGKLLKSKRVHQLNSPDEVTVRETYDYDHANRPIRLTHQVNEEPAVVLSEFEYNELGQLLEKNLGAKIAGRTPLQSVDYTYHIRGWLKGVNEVNANAGGFQAAREAGQPVGDVDDRDLFAYELLYEDADSDLQADSLFSGNISGMIWKSAGDEVKRAYGYGYDALKRLTSAYYGTLNPTSGVIDGDPRRYDVESISYDPNGNITALERYGKLVSGSFGVMDDLAYSYSGNQLQAVSDVASAQGVEDFTDVAGLVDYAYDVNGNLVSDANKGVTVSYNELNLPTLADFGQGRRIAWLYDASGRKLRKRVTDGTAEPLQINQRDYVEGFVYQDGDLEFFATSEGRVVPDGSGFRYEYFYSDHLGNTRMRFSDLNGDGVADFMGEVLQEEAYYPYGLLLQGLSGAIVGVEELRLFNGKELQREFGLNWMDYGARFYDAAVARWWVVDPMAEEYSEWSPYSYVLGNPLIYIDPDGKEPDIVLKGQNGSSLTIKTDLTEQEVEVDHDFQGNHEVDFSEAEPFMAQPDYAFPGKNWAMGFSASFKLEEYLILASGEGGVTYGAVAFGHPDLAQYSLNTESYESGGGPAFGIGLSGSAEFGAFAAKYIGESSDPEKMVKSYLGDYKYVNIAFDGAAILGVSLSLNISFSEDWVSVGISGGGSAGPILSYGKVILGDGSSHEISSGFMENSLKRADWSEMIPDYVKARMKKVTER